MFVITDCGSFFIASMGTVNSIDLNKAGLKRSSFVVTSTQASSNFANKIDTFVAGVSAEDSSAVKRNDSVALSKLVGNCFKMRFYWVYCLNHYTVSIRFKWIEKRLSLA